MQEATKHTGLLRRAGAFVRSRRKRLLLWLLAALICGIFSGITLHMSRYTLPWRTTKEFHHSGRYDPRPKAPTVLTLQPGQGLEQTFTVMGSLVGSCQEIYLAVPESQQLPVELELSLASQRTGEVLAHIQTQIEELTEDDLLAAVLSQPVMLESGQKYVLRIGNMLPDQSVALAMDEAVQSGSLTLEGEPVKGAVDFGFLRTAGYTPSPLVKLMILLICATVLAGLWLVLFCKVKEHWLYLLLAVGFGIVTLFDLTALYGFDMRFQFDSTYVMSNKLLGVGDEQWAPSQSGSGEYSVYYQRRICDDYSLFQYYKEDWVSDNYTDMQAALKDLRPEEEDQRLVLVETNQGFIGEQLPILYLPQAIGFSLARLLGLGFLPMVQLGRMASYAVFVLLMFFAIRSAPFGKRLFLILALLPSVLVQTVSISRDALVIGLSFFVVAKTLQLAYGEKAPNMLDWTVTWQAAALLAPCKGVYLPISLFWLVAVYCRIVMQDRAGWKRTAAYVAVGMLPIGITMSFFGSGYVTMVLSQLGSHLQNAFGGAVQAFVLPVQAAAAQTEAAVQAPPQMYTFAYILENLPFMLLVALNTLRVYLGNYFLNTIQLTWIDLGSNDLVMLMVLALLLIESLSEENKRSRLGKPERWSALAVASVVFALTAVAALGWTPAGSYTVADLQGRYLIPALPLLWLFVMKNSAIQLKGNHELLVKAGCCIFPAISLMNMYLWTISR